jgi:alkylation response protein AidB-like acyl-CoA dehydrogenase
VDASLDGFTVSRDIPKLGYKGTESCEVVLEDVRVPAEDLLGGEEGYGFKQALSALEIGRVNIAARSVGLGQASFDAALKYSKAREAFGKPISDFQAIQMKLADMATDVQAGRLLMWWAAAKMDTGERSDLETGMAKLWCSEMALRTSLTALRVHGGYGFSSEYEVERYYRDAPLMAIGEGTSDILRMVIAKSLLRGDAVV